MFDCWAWFSPCVSFLFHLQTVDRGCTVEGITQFAVVLSRALERRGCPHDFITELKLVLGTESDEEVFTFFHDKCSDFWATQEAEDLSDIGDATDVFLKAFFDGKSSLANVQ